MAKILEPGSSVYVVELVRKFRFSRVGSRRGSGRLVGTGSVLDRVVGSLTAKIIKTLRCQHGLRWERREREGSGLVESRFEGL